MKRFVCILTAALLISSVISAQANSKTLRIADTLTTKEKAERNPVLLRSELDSLIKLYAPVQLPVQEQKQEPERKESISPLILAGLLLVVLLFGFLMLMLFRQQKEVRRLTDVLKASQLIPAVESKNGKTRAVKKTGQPVTEEQLAEMNAVINRLEKENTNLNGVIKEYNGIKHDYDTLKQGILQAYKVKNYPGYEKARQETSSMKTVLDTEKAVADHAYVNFLKPVLALADANKNNPSKMSDEDKKKMLDLLISLSLFYIEYLYLRVSDLAVGGTIVERIQNFSKGGTTDKAVLKTLNKEAGSRALVMRMALDKAAISHLSYPVFDETNINQ